MNIAAKTNDNIKNANIITNKLTMKYEVRLSEGVFIIGVSPI